MAVNELSFSQSAAFLTDLYEQATGQKPTITEGGILRKTPMRCYLFIRKMSILII